jgi:hypothetical protein
MGHFGAETYLILTALDLLGLHQEAEDGFDQWLSLPVQPKIEPHQMAGEFLGDCKPDKHMGGSMSDRPTGNFSNGHGSLTLAEDVPGTEGHMDGVHAYSPGCIGWSLAEHYLLTNDIDWLNTNIQRIKLHFKMLQHI